MDRICNNVSTMDISRNDAGTWNSFVICHIKNFNLLVINFAFGNLEICTWNILSNILWKYELEYNKNLSSLLHLNDPVFMNMNISYLTWDDLTKQWATLSEQASKFFRFEIVFDVGISDIELYKDVSCINRLVNIINGSY